MWGDGDGHCGVVDDFSKCECDDLENNASCVVVKDVMHDQ